MVLTAVFITLVSFYSVVSCRLERTVITAPIIFTAAGLLIGLMPPWLSALELNRKAFLLIAEIGLVMTLAPKPPESILSYSRITATWSCAC